jgi:hypothetical protein
MPTTALSVVTMLTDLMSAAQALVPLVQQQLDGKEVTDEDMRAALRGKDAAMMMLDAQIAQREAAEARHPRGDDGSGIPVSGL